MSARSGASSRRLAQRGLALSLLVGVLALAACGGPETHSARGVVHEVLVEERQAMIEHEEIDGLMPAMTMNFTIYDEALLKSLHAGDVIEFELASSGGGFWITAAEVVGRASEEDGWARLGDTLVRADPAPAFELVDQSAEPVRLADLSGRTVLLDFIFTRCPGPCPVLTNRHVSVERQLSAALRERTHFVSISIDPMRDTPSDLRAYAESRGADLEHWSFLTGSPEVVSAVLAAYGVGTTRAADGELEHVIVTFLIDPAGRIVKRYLGVEVAASEILADIQAVAAGDAAARS